ALVRKWELHRERQARLLNLEARVKARTIDLEQTNERLRQEIEDHTHLEKEIQTLQKLEALGRLAAGIGHEINNPLTYVMTNIDLLLRDLSRQPLNIPKLRQLATESLEGAERIRDLIKRIKIYTHTNDDKTNPIDLRTIINNTLKLTTNEIK